ncbi:hypothetical protein WJR50_15615 [Catalinimonas sp. 4WD22]|uniref:hypothetical protein n=1 Tax=Catalinimonas locisalis TaxID=3133978 RepID=UPI0031017FE6
MDRKSLTATPFPALLIFSVFVFGIAGYHFQTSLHPLLMMLIGAVIGLLANLSLYYIIIYSGKALRQISMSLMAAVLSTVAALILVKTYAFRWPDQVFFIASLLGIVCAIIGYYSIRKLSVNQKAIPAWVGIATVVLCVGVGIYWLLQEGYDPYTETLPPPFENAKVSTLSEQGLENPASQGDYEVQTFTYGSGNDQKREEYAEAVRFKTPAVDASLLLPEWKGDKKKWRERYWGFGVTEFPLNGRVYLPEGEGPFPLVLIVHGNHSMIDYSDGGYAYLGELLASRGFITVSVDENFINAHWSGDFRGKEMPARAWLLLKHLEQWKKWNNSPEHELSGKVDMDNIMLVGHSRGGEAVCIAAVFNELLYFPDNADEEFNFNYNIKGVVSIAPTDYRYHRQIDLENVNYLSLQGSYDSDEISFWGMRTYRRLAFADSSNYFKAGVYLHQANHGQFNASWGRADFGAPAKWLLNTEPMLSGEEQREAAKVFISAFTEAALHDDKSYLPLFKNAVLARDWLPQEYYLTHFYDQHTQTLVDFEDDMDITTASEFAELKAENTVIWREENLSTRDGESQQNNAVVLGWDYGKEMQPDALASYEIVLKDSLGVQIDSSGSMLVTLAAGDYRELKQQDKEQNSSDEREEPTLNFSIVLSDRDGKTASMQLSDEKKIAPMLKTRFMKTASLSKDMIGDEWEVQPETFHLPLSKFQQNDSSFDLQQLRQIEFVFDQNNYGVIILDDIGFETIE